MNASKAFVAVSVIGIFGATYHAWTEKAFSTNIQFVQYSSLASFYGVPYWLFGMVWFPLILIVGFLTTGIGRINLKKQMIMLLTVGNIFTGYLLYLDILVVKAYDPLYFGLYATNYLLTGLVVYQNWHNDIIHGYVYGTLIGAVIGLLFGPFGLAACGITGGIFGALRNYAIPLKPQSRVSVSREASKIVIEQRN